MPYFYLFRDGVKTDVERKTKKSIINFASGMAKDWPEHRWCIVDGKGHVVHSFPKPDEDYQTTVLGQKIRYRDVTVYLEFMDNGWDILEADAPFDLRYVAEAVLSADIQTNSLAAALQIVRTIVDNSIEGKQL